MILLCVTNLSSSIASICETSRPGLIILHQQEWSLLCYSMSNPVSRDILFFCLSNGTEEGPYCLPPFSATKNNHEPCIFLCITSSLHRLQIIYFALIHLLSHKAVASYYLMTWFPIQTIPDHNLCARWQWSCWAYNLAVDVRIQTLSSFHSERCLGHDTKVFDLTSFFCCGPGTAHQTCIKLDWKKRPNDKTITEVDVSVWVVRRK